MSFGAAMPTEIAIHRRSQEPNHPKATNDH